MFIHVHIPKTAGTTLWHLFTKNFGEKYRRIGSDGLGKFFTDEELKNHIEKGFADDIEVLASHDLRPFSNEDYYKKDFHFFTLIREPVERVVSLYKHEKRRDKWNGVKESLAYLPFEEYVRERVKVDNAISNWQTYGIVETSRFKDALPVLDRIEVIGVTKEFDKTLILLSEAYFRATGKNFNIAYAPKNVAKNKKLDGKELSEDVIEFLHAENEEDYKLYNYAKEKLNRDFEKVENGKEKLNKLNFQKKVLGYREFCADFSKRLVNKLKKKA